MIGATYYKAEMKKLPDRTIDSRIRNLRIKQGRLKERGKRIMDELRTINEMLKLFEREKERRRTL